MNKKLIKISGGKVTAGLFKYTKDKTILRSKIILEKRDSYPWSFFSNREKPSNN